MRVWAVANQKGGVGKTTSTVNLAGPLAVAGRKTLLVDLDPHGSLTSYFGYDPDELKRSVYELFADNPPDPRDIILETGIPNLYLLPASTALATLDRQMGAKAGKGLIIQDVLQSLSGEFSYGLIDCPPVLGILMVNALAAAERLLIPVQTEFLALKGLERIVRTLNMIIQSRQHDLPYTIVPTMYDKRTKAAQESLQQLRETYPYTLWDEVIPVDTQFRDASKLRKPLTILNPRARGAIAYRKLLTRLLKIAFETRKQKPEPEPGKAVV